MVTARASAAYTVLLLLLTFCGDDPAPKPAVPPWAKVAPEQIAEAEKHGVPVAFENDLGMRFVLIPAGTFLMGSPEDEEGREDWFDEAQHEVTITKPFYVQITEVTNAQYREMVPQHDSREFKGHSLNADDQPVVHVRWEHVREFAAWLTRREGIRRYALPTEAQWERSCRAGTTSRFWFGERVDPEARYANGLDASSVEALGERGATEWPQADDFVVSAPVASYPPNPWGVHDVTGNVWEWCFDAYAPFSEDAAVDPTGRRVSRHHVLRGGSWGDGPNAFRSGARRGWIPLIEQAHLGFRLVADLPEANGAPSPLPPVARGPIGHLPVARHVVPDFAFEFREIPRMAVVLLPNGDVLFKGEVHPLGGGNPDQVFDALQTLRENLEVLTENPAWHAEDGSRLTTFMLRPSTNAAWAHTPRIVRILLEPEIRIHRFQWAVQALGHEWALRQGAELSGLPPSSSTSSRVGMRLEGREGDGIAAFALDGRHWLLGPPAGDEDAGDRSQREQRTREEVTEALAERGDAPGPVRVEISESAPLVQWGHVVTVFDLLLGAGYRVVDLPVQGWRLRFEEPGEVAR